MSASDKKKLRKEQNAAAMTERQLAEQKQQKKQKGYTLTFIITMVLVVAVVLCSSLATPISRIIVNNTVAVTVDSHKISAAELNYFYIDSISNLYSQFDDYGDYQDLYLTLYTGWTPSSPVGEQTYDSEAGTTWADYFADAAVQSAVWTYGLYDAAVAEGFTLTDEQLSAIESNTYYMELYAAYYGYSDADGYVRAIYGTSASMDSYEEYYTACYTASAYASAYMDSLEYTDAEIRAYETDKMAEYNSYSWLSYYVNASSYLTGGTTTTDEDGNSSTTYSDEEKQASVDAALADAELLIAAGITDEDSMNTAINALEINVEAETTKSATCYDAQLYSYVEYYAPNDEAVEWLTADERAVGDMTYVAYTTEDSDGNVTTNGYYVLFFVGSTDNSDINVGTVRHLLVAFEEDDDGNVTDEAKENAYLEATELLAEYQAGEQTEEAFTELIAEYSDDSEDGLYENITPDSGYVTAFADWAVADHEVGDVEIIETDYGYHIMYYVGCSDLNYRDTMIEDDMADEDYDAWEDAILENVTSETLNLDHIDRDFTMTSAS